MLWFALLVVQAAISPIDARTIPIVGYGVSAGLSNVAVLSATQLPNGYLLVGTQHGVFWYDGRHFMPLGPEQGLPAGDMAKAVAMTGDGDLVFVFVDTIYVARNIVQAATPDHLAFRKVAMLTTLSRDTYRKALPWHGGLVVTDHGRLLFVHRAGSGNVVDGLGATRILRGGSMDDISALFAQGDTLWVGTGDGRVCALSDRKPDCLSVPALSGPRRVDAITGDRQGVLYARTLHDVVRFDPTDRSTRLEAVPHAGVQYENYQRFLTLTWTPLGHLLTQTDDGQLALRSEQGWQTLTPGGEATSLPFSTLLFDRQRTLWMGVLGRGIVRTLGFGAITSFDRRDGLLGNVVWQTARQAGGPLWIATDAGITAFDTTTSTVLRNFVSPAYFVAVDAQGCIWHDGPDLVTRLDPVTGWHRDYRIGRTNRILPGRGNDLWILTDAGAWRADAARRDVAPERVPGLSGAYATGAMDPAGALWLIERRTLIVRHPDGGVAVVRRAWPQVGFAPNEIAIQNDHVLWITGQGGAYRVAHDGDTITALDFYDPSMVGSDAPYSVLVDHRGWVWIGSDHGLALIDGPRRTQITEADGLIANDLAQDSLLEDHDGSIWVGTSHGLSHIRQPENLFRQTTARPVITGMSIGGQRYEGGPIAATRAPFQVRFGTLDYRNAARTHFRYRLEGVDEGWNDTIEGTVRYPAVPPGIHHFLLVAYDPDTGRCSDPVSVTITMGRPWWQTTPVLLAAGLAVILLGYGLWRIRIGWLLRQQRLLQDIVERQTAEIRAAHEALIRQARHDSLTGLLNRGAIQAHLQSGLLEGNRDAPLAIGLVDVDHFKQINDHLGHLVGDDVLAEIGRRLQQALAPDEAAGRYGGEEFLIVLQGARDGAARMEVLRQLITGPLVPSCANVLRVTVSVGYAEARAGETWHVLVGRADRALYRAKTGGRNRMVAD
ncbi:diguanylate cyclase domain-containing protein [Gluconacetobacter tumulisoli]|uniref:diguanylate cyclase n=1 Tax=Gluconacetobacter tumulisoli TaxID=1286189 RepID=A0A7W4PLN9_9PROT|nr:diguanylate cyclase [Gluconacetobacter tumulisoli]